MKHLLLIVCALLGLQANAQSREFKPILKDGRVWKVVMPPRFDDMDEEENPDVYFTFAVSGDTIANGKACKKVTYRCDTATPKNFTPSKKGTVAAYEKDGRLYVNPGKDNDGVLMMDMNLHAGDNVNSLFSVYKEDEIDVHGQVLRRLTMTTGNFTDKNACWVEGIGPSQDLWATAPGYEYSPHDTYIYRRLVACYDNGELVFSAEDFDKQPLPNSIDTLTETGKKCGPMYNVLGQRISAPKKGELYIQNGEKRVKK